MYRLHATWYLNYLESINLKSNWFQKINSVLDLKYVPESTFQ